MEAELTLYKIDHFKVNNSVGFSTCEMLCIHHLYLLVTKHFNYPKVNPTPIR